MVHRYGKRGRSRRTKTRPDATLTFPTSPSSTVLGAALDHDAHGEPQHYVHSVDAPAVTASDAARPDRDSLPALALSHPVGSTNVPATPTMSTQSTTQTNDGRSESYEQYQYSPENHDLTSPAPEEDGSIPSTAPIEERRSSLPHSNLISADEDQDGEVVFEFGDQAPSQHSLSQNNHPLKTSMAMMPPPETPANHNPLFGKGQALLMPGSEMFKNTQFSTGRPGLGLSPTSSRPSPDVFMNNSISPNPIVSSPLQHRHVPQQSQPEMPSSSIAPSSRRLVDTLASQYGPETQEIPDSPSDPAPTHTRTSRQTSREPVTLFRSQRGRKRPRDPYDHPSDDNDDDEHLSSVRIKRVRSKKEAAIKTLRSVTLSRNSSREEEEEVEVPSTNKKRGRGRPRAVQKTKPALNHTKDPSEESTQEISLTDSQDNRAPPTTMSSRDAIPETSPPGTISTPVVDAVIDEDLTTQSQAGYESAVAASPSPPVTKTHSSDLAARPEPSSSPPVAVAEAPSEQLSTPLPPSSALTLARDNTSMSDLSSLGATPIRSNETTPATEDSASVASKTIADQISPAVAKPRRRGATQPAAKKRATSDRRTRQSMQRSPTSTDELARSPAPIPTPERNARASRIGKPLPASALEAAPTRTKLFDGMVFAISFQSQRPNEGVEYGGRTEVVSSIEKKIRQAGGKVLSSGFDELFETHPVKVAGAKAIEESALSSDADLKLTPAAALSTGFTALIADSHHRKSKYMQALALGLPCLSARWVTTCLDKGKVVDWDPYLLCAGQSSYLGNAIRSRCLVPYDPKTAQLQDIVQRRPRLLDGSNILLIMKRSEEVKKMAYVFLARALGASLSRVFTGDEARDRLKAAEDLGQPYDWVYGGDKASVDALFKATPTPESSAVFPMLNKARKRKRASGSATPTYVGPPPKRIRTLSDELVVQSLILGRLIENSEVEE